MTREQLYTVVSRGRAANHLYLPVGGDGDPHASSKPTSVSSQPRPAAQGSLPQRPRRLATTIRRQEQTAADRATPPPRAPVPSHELGYGRAAGWPWPGRPRVVVHSSLIMVFGGHAGRRQRRLGLPAC